MIAETTHRFGSWRRAHPPTFYLPLDDVRRDLLRPANGASFCEWKGAAAYVDVVVGERVASEAGWYYPNPSEPYAALADHVAFYAGRVDRCTVGGIVVTPQPGGLLRRLDHARRRRPVQGGAGHARVVKRRAGDEAPAHQRFESADSV